MTKDYINTNLMNSNGKINSWKTKNIEIPSKYRFCKSTREYIFCILNDVTHNPKCAFCETVDVKYKSPSEGYSKFCSSGCGHKIQTELTNLQTIKTTIPRVLTKQYIKKYLLTTQGNLNPHTVKFIKIPKEYSFCDTKSEYVHCVLMNIHEPVLCKSDICQNRVKYTGSKTYLNYCSGSCTMKSKEVQDKHKSTNLKKYNNINYRNINQQHQTVLLRYGVSNSFQTPNGKIGYQKYIESPNKIEQSVQKARVTKIKNNSYESQRVNLSRTMNKLRAGEGYVYLMFNPKTNLTKIGVSINPESRLKQLPQRYDNISIECLRFNDAYKIETFLHHKYHKFNSFQDGGGGTEWFQVSAPLLLQELVHLNFNESSSVDDT